MLVLIVDDHRSARRAIASLLEEMGDVQTVEAARLEEARAALERHPVDLALIDICLSEDARNRDGLTLLREVVERTTAVPVCVTASSDMETIRTAMRLGAYDYLLKDGLCEESLAPLINGLRDRRRLEREVTELRARVSAEPPAVGLIGTSPAMERLRGLIKKVALSDRPVLLLGPTGAGKEVVAQAIHRAGPNPDAPLLDLNCGAIPGGLIEAQLFGHERGAFTGAERRQPGHLATVGRGTLFLDEIAELPYELQASLLRVLETGRFRPLSAQHDQPFLGRVVAATHADLAERVRGRRFREDLYYRLNVLTVRVPPLDEHREDIPALVAHFVRQQRRRIRFTQGAVEALTRMPWPGNVRELRSLIDRAAVLVEGDEVTTEALAAISEHEAATADDVVRRCAREVLALPIGDKLGAMEEALVAEAMLASDHNKSAAARLLGVHRKSVERRVDRPQGDPPGDPPEA